MQKLAEDLENDYTKRGNFYPKMIVEEPGKDPRANGSGSKRYGKLAQGAGVGGARHIHPIPSEQSKDTAPSDIPRGESTGADGSLGHAN
jgi:hypothetical protein